MHNTGPLGCLPQKLSLIQTPTANVSVDQHGCISSYNSAARLFNDGLNQLCEKLRSEMKDATIVYVDIYSIKYDLIANSNKYGNLPHSPFFFMSSKVTFCQHWYQIEECVPWLSDLVLLKSISDGVVMSTGFSSPLMSCCGNGGPPYNYNMKATCGHPGSGACDEGSRFISWDGVHYTEAANYIVSSKILSTQYSTPRITFDFFCHWYDALLHLLLLLYSHHYH